MSVRRSSRARGALPRGWVAGLVLAAGMAHACAAGNTDRRVAVCGNHILEPGEECDDGNLTPGDGCDDACLVEHATPCGNHTVDEGEECDTGVGNSDTKPDACRLDCTLPRCGDGVKDTGEECDPPDGASCDEGCLAMGPRCGDGTCQADETVENCPDDCPVTCGDLYCSDGEDAGTCPDDCPASCGDGLCSPSENASACPEDCPVVCGDDVCSEGEDVSSCPDDCPVVCGDGVCSRPGENVSNCAAECGVYCGDGICTRPTEAINTCADDCGVFCGDGVCSRPSENVGSCPAECAVQCGDGICTTPAENAGSCPADCPVSCGDSACTGTENANNCPADCSPRCGDGVCTRPAENVSTCPAECNVYCGDGICSTTESWASCSADCDEPCTIVSDVSTYLGGASVVGTTATTPTHDAVDAACAAGTSPEAIYTIVPPFTGTLVVSLVNPGSVFDTVLALRQGTCETGTQVACNDDFAGLRSQLEAAVTSGTTYYVVVEGVGGATGAFELTAHQKGVCEGVGPVVSATSAIDAAFTSVTTTGGPASLRGVCRDTRTAPEALLTVVAPSTGTLVATSDLAGTDFDTVMYVRENDCDLQGAEVACNDDSNGLHSWVEWSATAGRTYSIVVDGYSSGSGNAEVAVGYHVARSPVTGALGACAGSAEDVYLVSVRPNDSLYVKADTVAADSAGDLCVQIYDDTNTNWLTGYDDQLTCTYPPPSWNCPEGTYTVGAYNQVHVRVRTCSSSCVNSANVGYQLTVNRNGSSVVLLRKQDQ